MGNCDRQFGIHIYFGFSVPQVICIISYNMCLRSTQSLHDDIWTSLKVVIFIFFRRNNRTKCKCFHLRTFSRSLTLICAIMRRWTLITFCVSNVRRWEVERRRHHLRVIKRLAHVNRHKWRINLITRFEVQSSSLKTLPSMSIVCRSAWKVASTSLPFCRGKINLESEKIHFIEMVNFKLLTLK